MFPWHTSSIIGSWHTEISINKYITVPTSPNCGGLCLFNQGNETHSLPWCLAHPHIYYLPTNILHTKHIHWFCSFLRPWHHTSETGSLSNSKHLHYSSIILGCGSYCKLSLWVKDVVLFRSKWPFATYWLWFTVTSSLQATVALVWASNLSNKGHPQHNRATCNRVTEKRKDIRIEKGMLHSLVCLCKIWDELPIEYPNGIDI